jgi:hypothetical protein
MVWFDICFGLLAVGAIAASPLYAHRVVSGPLRRLLGFGLLALPLPAAVGLSFARDPRDTLSQILLVLGVVSFVAGAVLVLADDMEEPPEGGPRTDSEPPWWPDFERAFRLYARKSRPARQAQPTR